jgi:EAL domain-containing protein (putative c-di-GMP-specific phosphodiesterase class I)
MAHGLGLTVTAEGVETREQAQYLMLRGCDSLQGYLFSRPQPAAALPEALAASARTISGLRSDTAAQTRRVL